MNKLQIDLDAMNNDPKANVLTLPKQKALAQQRSLPAPSLTSLNPDNGQFHYEAGYNIKIHTISRFMVFEHIIDFVRFVYGA